MSVFFGLFISPQEHKFKKLLKQKPEMLMYTSKKLLQEGTIFPAIDNEELKKEVIMSTNNEKIALLNLLYPFFSFSFGNNEYGAIILGENHDLLKLDKETANIYDLESKSFFPIVDKEGNFEGKWYSEENIQVEFGMIPRKIKFNDVLKEGIQVFWINSMETLKQIDEEMNNLDVKTGEQKLEYLINQTNWKNDKVVYMNKYKNICPVKQTDDGFMIEYHKMGNKGKSKIDD